MSETHVSSSTNDGRCWLCGKSSKFFLKVYIGRLSWLVVKTRDPGRIPNFKLLIEETSIFFIKHNENKVYVF